GWRLRSVVGEGAAPPPGRLRSSRLRRAGRVDWGWGHEREGAFDISRLDPSRRRCASAGPPPPAPRTSGCDASKRGGMFRLCITSRKLLIRGDFLLDQLVIGLLIVPE